jgi:polysaccharide biosynthesis transport protein
MPPGVVIHSTFESDNVSLGGDMEPVTYLRIVQKRLILILIAGAVAAGVVFLAVSAQPYVYTSTTKLRVVPFGINGPDYGAFVYFERLAATYTDLLTGETVVQKAEQQLGLQELPSYQIDLIPQTELLRILVVDTDPARAQRVGQTLTEILIEENSVVYNANVEQIETTLGEEVEALEAQINDLTAELSELRNQVPLNTARVAEIERLLEAARQNYNLRSTSYNQVLVSLAAQANTISVIEPASLPTEPSGPARTRNILLAGVIGLLGGMVFSFILESANPRMHTYKAIETAAGSEIIGKVPFLARKARRNVFTTDAQAADAFRRLRTNVFSTENPPRLLLVTSAVPDEGKTTIALNLARSIALNGKKTVLVDADMRMPTLHTALKLPNQSGLSSILRGEVKPEDVLIESDTPNLRIITAGPSTFASSEMIGSPQMVELIVWLSRYFEVVIFDAPALLSVTDAAVLAPSVEAVLLVVDRIRSEQKSTMSGRDELEKVGVNPIGIVVNRVPRNDTVYGRKYQRKM